MTRFQKLDVTTSADLTSAPLSYTTTYSRKFKLEQIIFKASEAITETITITLDSAKGANYDVILRKVTLTSESSYVFRPEGEANFQDGDEIKIQCTDANSTGSIYVQIKTSELP